MRLYIGGLQNQVELVLSQVMWYKVKLLADMMTVQCTPSGSNQPSKKKKKQKQKTRQL